MVRSKLRNKYLKSKSEIYKQRYNKQRNYYIKLLRLKKQKYYESLDISKITNYFQSYSTNSRITIFKIGEMLSEESKVADTFNKFFSNVFKVLKIEKDNNLLTEFKEETNPKRKAIKT